MNNKASTEFWNKRYENIKPYIIENNNVIKQWIDRFLPNIENAECIEIGCYPGRFLTIFGEKGYKLYGIDLAEKTPEIPLWLKANNYNVGTFWQEDFTIFVPPTKFDLVLSFGFIEHFINWEEILEKHLEYVENNGFLVVEAPNLLGTFQNYLHRNFNREYFKKHHIPAMDIAKWKKIVEKHGFKILYSGYFEQFDFFLNNPQNNKLVKLILKLLKRISPFLGWILPKNKKTYSPFGGIIAQKLD